MIAAYSEITQKIKAVTRVSNAHNTIIDIA